MNAVKGDWIRIHKIVLTPEERASQIPEDTKQVPLEMWDKGFLISDSAAIDDEVEVETIIGRRVQGRMIEVNPQYDHAWGKGVPEILQIGRQLRSILAEEEN
jgi:hypothetical protein